MNTVQRIQFKIANQTDPEFRSVLLPIGEVLSLLAVAEAASTCVHEDGVESSIDRLRSALSRLDGQGGDCAGTHDLRAVVADAKDPLCVCGHLRSRHDRYEDHDECRDCDGSAEHCCSDYSPADRDAGRGTR
jgi:hypothetical protein